ncbi:MAG: MFS transporter, partial [Micrococcales bacterium]|nr:MFS transporter [Micrococcales bacterium]
WLTSSAFVAPGSDIEATKALHSQWLGWGVALAGVLVALTAPALGAVADASGRRRPMLATTSSVIGLTVLALWFVRPGNASTAVLLGVTLLAVGTVAFEVGSVAYNALLVTITTPRTIGRISGLGWGSGYVGGIVLLLALYVGLINGPEDGAHAGLANVATADGLNYRVAMVVAGVWFIMFALPVLFLVPDEVRVDQAKPARMGMADAYRTVWADLVRLWRADRTTVKFLVASAVFRDGLTGVFTFGGVLAAGTFGFTGGQVIVFGIAANIIAGIATISVGWLDDRVGPRRVITWSLVVLVVAGAAVFVFRDAGAPAFWVFGLILSSCVGPAQSASRALLARLSPKGHETEMFGLYATTGRAATFMAPAAFATCIWASGKITGHEAQYWGILGIVAVLVAGLALFVPLRFPRGLGADGREDLAAPAA